MQKHVNLVDLVKSFPTNIYLQNLASIQKRTSPVRFAHLAEKSGKGSISNLSTKVPTQPRRLRAALGRKCLLHPGQFDDVFQDPFGSARFRRYTIKLYQHRFVQHRMDCQVTVNTDFASMRPSEALAELIEVDTDPFKPFFVFCRISRA